VEAGRLPSAQASPLEGRLPAVQGQVKCNYLERKKRD